MGQGKARGERRGAKDEGDGPDSGSGTADPTCQGPRVDQLLKDHQKQQSKDELTLRKKRTF